MLRERESFLKLKLANFYVHKRLVTDPDPELFILAQRITTEISLIQHREAGLRIENFDHSDGDHMNHVKIGNSASAAFDHGLLGRPFSDALVAASEVVAIAGDINIASNSIIVSAHLGPFVAGSLALSQNFASCKFGVMFDSSTKNPMNSIWDQLFNLTNGVIKVFHTDKSGILRAVRHLRSGGILGVLPDIYDASSGSVVVEMNRKIWLARPLIGWLARVAGSRVFVSSLISDGTERLRTRIEKVEISQCIRTNHSSDYINLIEIFSVLGRHVFETTVPWVYRDFWDELPGLPMPSTSRARFWTEMAQLVTIPSRYPIE